MQNSFFFLVTVAQNAGCYTLIIHIWVALIRAFFCETHHEILEHLLSWGLWSSTVFYHSYWTQSHCRWQFRVI